MNENEKTEILNYLYSLAKLMKDVEIEKQFPGMVLNTLGNEILKRVETLMNEI